MLLTHMAVLRLGPGGDYVTEFGESAERRARLVKRKGRDGRVIENRSGDSASRGVGGEYRVTEASRGDWPGADWTGSDAAEAADGAGFRGLDQAGVIQDGRGGLALNAGQLAAAAEELARQGTRLGALAAVWRQWRAWVAQCLAGVLTQVGAAATATGQALKASPGTRTTFQALWGEEIGEAIEDSSHTSMLAPEAVDRAAGVKTTSPTDSQKTDPQPADGPGISPRTRAEVTERTAPYEPDTKAVTNPPADPGLAHPPGLLPNDARARGRDRRQQGHGLRARRGAHQEGRAGARAEQGTLFVDR